MIMRSKRVSIARHAGVVLSMLSLGVSGFGAPALAADKPTILVIFGDDVGLWNVGAYSHGMMGPTPNIDRIAKEGMLFTDHYAHPSCTAGRAAFITGQLPVRTGMTTIGIPGSTLGLQQEDPTLAEVLKPLAYTTAQFGKNHLGDRNEFLPTVHGFDEFYGNLYHLNAEEEPEQLDYPGVKNPAFTEEFGPRGVLHCFATDTDDPTEDPKFGPMDKQRCENTGALTRERMKTVDGEFLQAAETFIDRSASDDEPFFVWFYITWMHIGMWAKRYPTSSARIATCSLERATAARPWMIPIAPLSCPWTSRSGSPSATVRRD